MSFIDQSYVWMCPTLIYIVINRFHCKRFEYTMIVVVLNPGLGQVQHSKKTFYWKYVAV